MKAHYCFVLVTSFLVSAGPPAFSQLKAVFPIYEPASVRYQSSIPLIERDTALERRIANAHIKTITRWKWGYGLPDEGQMVDSTFYDTKGRICWMLVSSNPGLSNPALSTQHVLVFSYDSSGNLAQMGSALPVERSEPGQDLKGRIIYTYNRDGQIIRKVSEAEQGKTEYAYNGAGLLEEETMFDRDGIYSRTFYIYNKGRLEEARSYTRGEMKEIPDRLTRYTVDGNRQTEEVFMGGSLVERHVMKLDKKGRIVERRGYDSDVRPAPLLNQIFSYDKKGSLVSETIQCESNPFAPETRQIYTYNEKGFPIIRKRYSGKEVTDGTVYVYRYYGIKGKEPPKH